MALDPGKSLVICPDCGKEIIISATDKRYTCPVCREVFTSPGELDKLPDKRIGRFLVIVGLMVLVASIFARLGLLGSDAYHSILPACLIPGSILTFIGRRMLRD